MFFEGLEPFCGACLRVAIGLHGVEAGEKVLTVEAGGNLGKMLASVLAIPSLIVTFLTQVKVQPQPQPSIHNPLQQLGLHPHLVIKANNLVLLSSLIWYAPPRLFLKLN